MLPKVLAEDDSLRIFLQITIPRLRNSSNLIEMIQDISLKYGILPTYRSKSFTETKKFRLTPGQLTKKGADFILISVLVRKTSQVL